jgi:hypothetical protein
MDSFMRVGLPAHDTIRRIPAFPGAIAPPGARVGPADGNPRFDASIQKVSEIIFVVHSGGCREPAPAGRQTVTAFFSIA